MSRFMTACLVPPLFALTISGCGVESFDPDGFDTNGEGTIYEAEAFSVHGDPADDQSGFATFAGTLVSSRQGVSCSRAQASGAVSEITSISRGGVPRAVIESGQAGQTPAIYSIWSIVDGPDSPTGTLLDQQRHYLESPRHGSRARNP